MKKSKSILLIGALITTTSLFAVNGQTLLKQKGCMGCHNIQGQKIGPSFNDVAQKNIMLNQENAKSVIMNSIKNGIKDKYKNIRMQMPPFKNLSNSDLDKIASYILSLKQNKTTNMNDEGIKQGQQRRMMGNKDRMNDEGMKQGQQRRMMDNKDRMNDEGMKQGQQRRMMGNKDRMNDEGMKQGQQRRMMGNKDRMNDEGMKQGQQRRMMGNKDRMIGNKNRINNQKFSPEKFAKIKEMILNNFAENEKRINKIKNCIIQSKNFNELKQCKPKRRHK